MLAIEIILVLITVGNAAWAVINYRVTSTLLGRANEVAALLTKAKGVSEAANIDKEFGVCFDCERIVTRHQTDEQGVTRCVNCAAEKAKLLLSTSNAVTGSVNYSSRAL
jgi:hypothetical protein